MRRRDPPRDVVDEKLDERLVIAVGAAAGVRVVVGASLRKRLAPSSSLPRERTACRMSDESSKKSVVVDARGVDVRVVAGRGVGVGAVGRGAVARCVVARCCCCCCCCCLCCSGLTSTQAFSGSDRRGGMTRGGVGGMSVVAGILLFGLMAKASLLGAEELSDARGGS